MNKMLPDIKPSQLPNLRTNIQPPVISLPQQGVNTMLPDRLVKYALPYNPNLEYRKTKNYMFNYNDPHEINSMADVLSQAMTLNGGRDLFKNLWTGTWDLFKRGTLDPIKAGEMGQAALNSLISFGEGADLLANPVKALLQGYGEEGVKNALGFGEAGRINYDWDTGSFLTDMFLEVISDPTAMISIFPKAIAIGRI